MRMDRSRLTATDIVAPPVAPDRLAEYRRFGYVSDLTMSASVLRAARQWGSRPAIIEGGQQLTYQELLEVVERAAAWLAGAGVGPGNVVCWQTPNWWEAHVLGLAIWHAGAVSCPIAPFYREHELRQVIEQVGPASATSPASCCAEPGRAGRHSTWSSRTADAKSPPPSGPMNPAWSSSLPGPRRVPRPRCIRRAPCWRKPASSPTRGACRGRPSPTWPPRCSTSPASSMR